MNRLKILLSIFSFAYVYTHAFYSQFGQDEYIYRHYFSDDDNQVRFFVDIGAYDDISFSNSKYFENLGWQGICIEPLPEIFEQLCANCSCICINGCITDQPGIVEFTQILCESIPTHQMLSGITQKYDVRHVARIDRELVACGGGIKKIIKVPGYLLSDILERYYVKHVDYLSLDVEVGELEILKTIPPYITINVISVENNYHTPDIKRFLASRGFKLVVTIACDEIYVRKEFARASKSKSI